MKEGKDYKEQSVHILPRALRILWLNDQADFLDIYIAGKKLHGAFTVESFDDVYVVLKDGLGSTPGKYDIRIESIDYIRSAV